jgi:hypothetical protein
LIVFKDISIGPVAGGPLRQFDTREHSPAYRFMIHRPIVPVAELMKQLNVTLESPHAQSDLPWQCRAAESIEPPATAAGHRFKPVAAHALGWCALPASAAQKIVILDFADSYTSTKGLGTLLQQIGRPCTDLTDRF